MDSALALNQFNQFEQQARRDAIFLGLFQSVRSYAFWWLRIIVIVFLGWFVFLVAQYIPVFFRKHLNQIYPALPFINEKKTMEWLKNTFQLYYFTLKGYRALAVNKKPFDVLMEELD